MTPADVRGIVREILKHPDDDMPRLVYADALEDGGEVLAAEFIRCQCGVITSMHADAPAAARRALLPASLRSLDVGFERGFVVAIHNIPLDLWAMNGAWLCFNHPLRVVRPAGWSLIRWPASVSRCHWEYPRDLENRMLADFLPGPGRWNETADAEAALLSVLKRYVGVR
jgi:uncharacterized protein (TIGR02996 family)